MEMHFIFCNNFCICINGKSRHFVVLIERPTSRKLDGHEGAWPNNVAGPAHCRSPLPGCCFVNVGDDSSAYLISCPASLKLLFCFQSVTS